MTLKEENDLLLRSIVKQCVAIKALIEDINNNLREEENRLTVEIAEQIANKGGI